MVCSSCASEKPDPNRDPRWRRALWIALAVNGAMFVGEIVAGVAGGSKSLQADALDFLGDSANYAISLAVVGMVALVANAGVALMLYRWRSGDANMRSVWICSRNDVIGNLAVVLAAVGVFGTGTRWPDLVVAGIMATLGLWGGTQIVLQALRELRDQTAPPAAPGVTTNFAARG